MTKVILGGGLSGLSATYYLSKSAQNAKITLLESSERLGGWIKSSKVSDGIIFEQGPRTIRPRGIPGANTLELVEELNLSDEIRPILTQHPAARNRMIYANGRLHSLPMSVRGLFEVSEPFSRPLIVDLFRGVFVKSEPKDDISIYEFAEKKFGSDVADYLVSPLICGICAGNAKEISVKFLMEDLYNKEQKYGSIAKGVFKNLFSKKRNVKKLSGLALQAKEHYWSVYSFKNGIETLPNTLENSLKNRDNVDILLNKKCKEIYFNNNNSELIFDKNDKIICDHIISSISSQNLANLLKNQHPKLSEMLNKISNVTVAVVNLHFKNKLIQNEGFGFLVPPKENLPILGVIYDSCCFPSEENTVLTVMLGGHWYNKYFSKNNDEKTILNTALEQLRNILNISEDPLNYKVNILENCIPQYVVGHRQNVININNYILQNKLSLSLCGSSYYGVGVNDVILSAKKCVENILNK